MCTHKELAAQPQTQNVGGAAASLAEIERAAIYIAKSGLFGVKTQEQAAALMLVAQSEGSHYARAAMAYDVINGRPALKSSEILSRFQGSGGKIRYKRTDETCCEVELEHPQGGSLAIKWDMDRARKAGLADKDTWKKYPAALLRARAVAEGVRALYPACLGGFHATEEVQDFGDGNPKSPIKAEAEVVAETPVTYSAAELKVNIDGATPAPPAANGKPGCISGSETKNICSWIKGELPDQGKALQVVGKYCKPENIGTISHAQADKLVSELCSVFGITYNVTWRDF
jgi:hypothetical protein